MQTIEAFVDELNKKWPKTPFGSSFLYVAGKKYHKICKSRDGIKPDSAYAFIDIKTGDLYRAASWAIPAKHIRGNINDASGLDACEEYGVRYLR
jgi:hypothetical protein